MDIIKLNVTRDLVNLIKLNHNLNYTPPIFPIKWFSHVFGKINKMYCDSAARCLLSAPLDWP
jgi:hypothetical protein